MESSFSKIKKHWRTPFRWTQDLFTSFIPAYLALRHLEKGVTFFGSARLDETNHHYQLVRQIAKHFGEQGYTIITGGGPGLMEAANRGAIDSHAPSIGCSIRLIKHEPPNRFLTTKLFFRTFIMRKIVLRQFSTLFVVAPGGYGTLDELFELLVLVQTNKFRLTQPIFLLSRDFWEPIMEVIEQTMISASTISKDDLRFVQIVDTYEEIQSRLNSSPSSTTSEPRTLYPERSQSADLFKKSS